MTSKLELVFNTVNINKLCELRLQSLVLLNDRAEEAFNSLVVRMNGPKDADSLKNNDDGMRNKLRSSKGAAVSEVCILVTLQDVF